MHSLNLLKNFNMKIFFIIILSVFFLSPESHAVGLHGLAQMCRTALGQARSLLQRGDANNKNMKPNKAISPESEFFTNPPLKFPWEQRWLTQNTWEGVLYPILWDMGLKRFEDLQSRQGRYRFRQKLFDKILGFDRENFLSSPMGQTKRGQEFVHFLDELYEKSSFKKYYGVGQWVWSLNGDREMPLFHLDGKALSFGVLHFALSPGGKIYVSFWISEKEHNRWDKVSKSPASNSWGGLIKKWAKKYQEFFLRFNSDQESINGVYQREGSEEYPIVHELTLDSFQMPQLIFQIFEMDH